MVGQIKVYVMTHEDDRVMVHKTRFRYQGKGLDRGRMGAQGSMKGGGPLGS